MIYDSIYELPIKIYFKVIEESSLKFLGEGKEEELQRAWDKINEQLIDNFGLPREEELLFYKRQQLNKIELELLLGNRENETLGEILKSDINQIENHKKTRGEVKDFRKYNARLVRILHERYNRNPKDLTTFEFFTDLNDLQEEQSRKEKKNARRDKIRRSI